MSDTHGPSNPSGHFLVATSDDCILARVVGRGTMTNSIAFQQFLEHLQGEGYRRLVLDLAECRGFDSTFMGILLGLASSGTRVVLINATPGHRKLLSDVGLERVLTLCDQPLPLPGVAMQRLEQKPIASRDRFRHILAAHENLMRLDSSNRQKFGPFLEELRRELGEEDAW